jgi:hypothetical protein
MFLIAMMLSGCADFQMFGVAAAERRQRMNDIQARATMLAVCDISIGSSIRELSPAERTLADRVCGEPWEGEIEQLRALERP